MKAEHIIFARIHYAAHLADADDATACHCLALASLVVAIWFQPSDEGNRTMLRLINASR